MTDSRTTNDPAEIDRIREPEGDAADPGIAPQTRSAPGDPDSADIHVDEAPPAEEEAAKLGDFA